MISDLPPSVIIALHSVCQKKASLGKLPKMVRIFSTHFGSNDVCRLLATFLTFDLTLTAEKMTTIGAKTLAMNKTQIFFKRGNMRYADSEIGRKSAFLIRYVTTNRLLAMSSYDQVRPK